MPSRLIEKRDINFESLKVTPHVESTDELKALNPENFTTALYYNEGRAIMFGYSTSSTEGIQSNYGGYWVAKNLSGYTFNYNSNTQILTVSTDTETQDLSHTTQESAQLEVITTQLQADRGNITDNAAAIAILQTAVEALQNAEPPETSSGGLPEGGNEGDVLTRGSGSSASWEPPVSDASETIKGKVELATTDEAKAGIDTSKAMTPATHKAATDQYFGESRLPDDWNDIRHPGVYAMSFNSVRSATNAPFSLIAAENRVPSGVSYDTDLVDRLSRISNNYNLTLIISEFTIGDNTTWTQTLITPIGSFSRIIIVNPGSISPSLSIWQFTELATKEEVDAKADQTDLNNATANITANQTSIAQNSTDITTNQNAISALKNRETAALPQVIQDFFENATEVHTDGDYINADGWTEVTEITLSNDNTAVQTGDTAVTTSYHTERGGYYITIPNADTNLLLGITPRDTSTAVFGYLAREDDDSGAGNDLETHLAVPILEISGGNYRVGTGVNDSSEHAYQNLQDSTELSIPAQTGDEILLAYNPPGSSGQTIEINVVIKRSSGTPIECNSVYFTTTIPNPLESILIHDDEVSTVKIARHTSNYLSHSSVLALANHTLENDEIVYGLATEGEGSDVIEIEAAVKIPNLQGIGDDKPSFVTVSNYNEGIALGQSGIKDKGLVFIANRRALYEVVYTAGSDSAITLSQYAVSRFLDWNGTSIGLTIEEGDIIYVSGGHLQGRVFLRHRGNASITNSSYFDDVVNGTSSTVVELTAQSSAATLPQWQIIPKPASGNSYALHTGKTVNDIDEISCVFRIDETAPSDISVGKNIRGIPRPNTNDGVLMTTTDRISLNKTNLFIGGSGRGLFNLGIQISDTTSTLTSLELEVSDLGTYQNENSANAGFKTFTLVEVAVRYKS